MQLPQRQEWKLRAENGEIINHSVSKIMSRDLSFVGNGEPLKEPENDSTEAKWYFSTSDLSCRGLEGRGLSAGRCRCLTPSAGGALA